MVNRFRYTVIWIISAILLLVALSINNIFWLSKSPEWDTTFIVHNTVGTWVGPINTYSAGELTNYLLFYRVFTVWSNWRDIGSAIVVGFIIMMFARYIDRIRTPRHDSN